MFPPIDSLQHFSTYLLRDSLGRFCTWIEFIRLATLAGIIKDGFKCVNVKFVKKNFMMIDVIVIIQNYIVFFIKQESKRGTL